jgi:hypothetical protein
MRRIGISIVMLVLSSGLAAAQTAAPGSLGASALGVTSPFGMLGSNPVGPTGIPLGSTELNFGGLSPAPITPLSSTTSCFATTFGTTSGMSGTGTTVSGMAGTGAATSNFTFDGGGSAPSLTGGCTSVPVGTAGGSAGTASPLSNPGTPGLATLNGGTIPLGATELNSAGLSPIVPVQGPTTTTGTTTTSGSMTSFGMTGFGQ